MIKKRSNILFFVLVLILIMNLTTYSETMRDRATVHFNQVDWSVNKEIQREADVPGKIIPGGNEIFPVISSDAKTAKVSIYPEIDQLGPLDYTDIDGDLVKLLYSTAIGLEKQKIDGASCNPERPFIAAIATYQVLKLPVPQGVLFSRPQKIDDLKFTTKFRMQFLKNSVPAWVFVTVLSEKSNSLWKINEITYDSETYASLVESN